MATSIISGKTFPFSIDLFSTLAVSGKIFFPFHEDFRQFVIYAPGTIRYMREPKKILLEDESEEFLTALLNHPRSRSFVIKAVKELPITGFMKRASRQLSATDKVPENPALFAKLRIEVILICYHGMIQNYRCAAKLGANYFLQKPVAPMQSPPFSNIPRENSYLKFWHPLHSDFSKKTPNEKNQTLTHSLCHT